MCVAHEYVVVELRCQIRHLAYLVRRTMFAPPDSPGAARNSRPLWPNIKPQFVIVSRFDYSYNHRRYHKSIYKPARLRLLGHLEVDGRFVPESAFLAYRDQRQRLCALLLPAEQEPAVSCSAVGSYSARISRSVLLNVMQNALQSAAILQFVMQRAVQNR
jgi:hypothetical protein